MPTNYIPTLDGWRALAVSGVIFIHAVSPDSPLHVISQFGSHGVNVFFAISGFLITSRLLDEEIAFGRISLKNFYLRRAFRILPAAHIYIFILLLLPVFITPLEVLACFGFFRNYIATPPDALYTGHFWSLAVEEHFYLLWPAILVWLGRRNATLAAPIFAVLITLWRFADSRFGIINLADTLNYQRTDRVLDGLLWGCALALVLNDKRLSKTLFRYFNQVTWLVVVCLWLASIIITFPLSATVEALTTPLVLLGTINNPKNIFSGFLESPLLIWLGRLSYSLYIWQELFFVAKFKEPTNIIQSFPVNLFALLAVASLSYYLIEKPLIRFARRLTQALTDLSPFHNSLQ